MCAREGLWEGRGRWRESGWEGMMVVVVGFKRRLRKRTRGQWPSQPNLNDSIHHWKYCCHGLLQWRRQRTMAIKTRPCVVMRDERGTQQPSRLSLNYWMTEWTETVTRYCYSGHVLSWMKERILTSHSIIYYIEYESPQQPRFCVRCHVNPSGNKCHYLLFHRSRH